MLFQWLFLNVDIKNFKNKFRSYKSYELFFNKIKNQERVLSNIIVSINLTLVNPSK